MLNKLELLLPPLPLTFFIAALMWLIDQSLAVHIQFSGQALFATFLLILGILFIFPAAVSFIRAKTTVDPRTPNKSNSLVITGLYRISRNPMYVGMVLCLLALSLSQGNIINLMLSFAFVGYLNRFQIQPEEHFLKEKFGEQYVQYCTHVRRWI
ncbi:isoprenylcysteine carboxylmethyltransferase family protein [Oceaniserpentilla sp. 4NH20-0058]|uniref:methyltransferase family protein n=1 Tax=Oceaniserpentilla sp. 4NH20-0058 TaxID=3127660 RepID=UPI003107AE3D